MHMRYIEKRSRVVGTVSVHANVGKADLHPDGHVRLTERGSLAVVPMGWLLRAVLHLKKQAEQTRKKKNDAGQG